MTRREKTFPWVGASLVAAAGVALGWLFVDSRGPAGTDEIFFPRDGGARVALSRMQEGAEDGGEKSVAELSLHDPTPLFLPTGLNSGRVETKMTAERSQGAPFADIAAKMVFPDEDNRLSVPDVVQVQGKALDVLEHLAPPISLRELARADKAPLRLPRRTALLEVRRIADGAVVLSESIDAGSADSPALVPIELMVVVNNAGLLTDRGALDVAAGGGTLPLFGQQQVDLDQLNKLLKNSRLGAKLAGGIYRISLGP